MSQFQKGDLVKRLSDGVIGIMTRVEPDTDGDVRFFSPEGGHYSKLHDLVFLYRPGSGNYNSGQGTTESWSFKSVASPDIDHQLIIDSLTTAQPLLLITAGDKKMVAVHKSLVTKAIATKIAGKPRSVKVYSDGLSAVVRISGEFNQWVTWAKSVKSAKWPVSMRDPCTVTVTAVKV